MFDRKEFGFVTDTKIWENNKNIKSYSTWNGMIHRCYNKNSKSYKNYGAKGVTVCEEWKTFSNFKKWYDENYIEGYELDKDFKGGKIYSPENCVFVSKRENILEARKRTDYSYLKERRLDKNPSFKDVAFYETNHCFRHTFKKVCETRGLKFEDFEEIFSGITQGKNRKFFYKLKKTEEK